MHRFLLVLSAFSATWALVSADPPAASPSPAPASTPSTNAPPTPVPARSSLYDLTVNSLDGKPVALAQYRGHVALVVNTASQGGFNWQYKQLEEIFNQYKDKGFFVFAFPCNDFGGQEPGSSSDIAAFCKTKYDITFPIFEKVKTQGPGQSPVYQFLTTGRDKPHWNFHKYLIDKNGQVIGEFPDRIAPQDKEIHTAIEAALKS